MPYRPETPSKAQRAMTAAEGIENKALSACLESRRTFIQSYANLAHSGADLTTLADISRGVIDAMRIAYRSALYDAQNSANQKAGCGRADNTPAP